MMVAAMYLVREIHQAGCTVRLFEGFVSYKDGSMPSSHINDVLLLREIVRDLVLANLLSEHPRSGDVEPSLHAFG